MTHTLRRAAARAIACLLFVAGTGTLPAYAEADGPDAWRVTGVAPNDVLNMRMGPGTDYPVIGELAPDARHLVPTTCVPLHTMGQFMALGEAQKESLPARWCLVTEPASLQKGWVAQRFLAEDVLAGDAVAEGEDDTPWVADWSQDPGLPGADALEVVRDLYAAYAETGPDLLTSVPAAQQYFYTGLASKVANGTLGADPLYGTQDSDISDVVIELDPETPVLRGMTTVLVSFTNFGRHQRSVVSLRADPDQGGAQRIFRIEHNGWTVQ